MQIHPRVVIVMPVYNEARHLPIVLESLQRQVFDRRRMFLIGVDGGSTDESKEILHRWFAATAFPGCILSNPRRKIAVSLNLALQQTTTDDMIVRVDAHSIYGETYIAEAVSALENSPADVGCIGAAHRPVPEQTFARRLVVALYTNPMGLGGADFRLGDDVREADSVYLGAWRPGVLNRAGGFNECMEANEDAELAARIRAMGYRILRVPLPCRFVVNRGIWSSIRQWNRYGYWRAKMLKLHPKRVRLRHVANPVAVVLACALLSSPTRVLLLPAFAGYALLVFRGRADDEPFPVTLASLVFFPVLQFAFAFGMLAGLVTAPISKWPRPSSGISAEQAQT